MTGYVGTVSQSYVQRAGMAISWGPEKLKA
jgi:hypothetical protein